MAWNEIQLKLVGKTDFGNSKEEVKEIVDSINGLKKSFADMPNFTRIMDNSLEKTATIATGLGKTIDKLSDTSLNEEARQKYEREGENAIAELNANKMLRIDSDSGFSNKLAHSWFASLPAAIRAELDAVTPEVSNIIRSKISNVTKNGFKITSSSINDVVNNLVNHTDITDKELLNVLKKHNVSSETGFQFDRYLKYLLPNIIPSHYFSEYQKARYGSVLPKGQNFFDRGAAVNLLPASYRSSWGGRYQRTNFTEDEAKTVLSKEYRDKLDVILANNPIAVRAAIASGISRRDNRGRLETQEEISRSQWEDFRSALYDEMVARTAGMAKSKVKDPYKHISELDRKTIAGRLTQSSSGQTVNAMHDIEAMTDASAWISGTNNKYYRKNYVEPKRSIDSYVVTKYSPFTSEKGYEEKKDVEINESQATRVLGQKKWKHNDDVSDVIRLISLEGYDKTNKEHSDELLNIIKNGKDFSGKQFVFDTIHAGSNGPVIRMISKSERDKANQRVAKWATPAGFSGTYFGNFSDDIINDIVENGADPEKLTAKMYGKHYESLNKKWSPSSDLGLSNPGNIKIAVVDTKGTLNGKEIEFGDGAMWASREIVGDSFQTRIGAAGKGSTFVFTGKNLGAAFEKWGLLDEQGRAMVKGPNGEYYDASEANVMLPLSVIKNQMAYMKKNDDGTYSFRSSEEINKMAEAEVKNLGFGEMINYNKEKHHTDNIGVQQMSFLNFTPETRLHQINMAMQRMQELETEAGQLKYVFGNQDDWFSRQIQKNPQLLGTEQAKTWVDNYRTSLIQDLVSGTFIDFGESDNKFSSAVAASSPLSTVLQSMYGGNMSGMIGKAREILKKSGIEKEYTDQEIEDMIVLKSGDVVDFSNQGQERLTLLRSPTGYGNILKARNIASDAVRALYEGFGIDTTAGVYMSEADRDILQGIDFDSDHFKIIRDPKLVAEIEELTKNQVFSKQGLESEISDTGDLKNKELQALHFGERTLEKRLKMGTGSGGVRGMQLDLSNPLIAATYIPGMQMMQAIYDYGSTDDKNPRTYKTPQAAWDVENLQKEYTKFSDHIDRLFQYDDDMYIRDENGELTKELDVKNPDLFFPKKRNLPPVNMRNLREMGVDTINAPAINMANQVMGIAFANMAYRNGMSDTTRWDAASEAMVEELEYGTKGPARQELMRTMRRMLPEWGSGRRGMITPEEEISIREKIRAAKEELKQEANQSWNSTSQRYVSPSGKEYKNIESYITTEGRKYSIQTANQMLDMFGFTQHFGSRKLGADFFGKLFENFGTADITSSYLSKYEKEINETARQLEEAREQQRKEEQEKSTETTNKQPGKAEEHKPVYKQVQHDYSKGFGPDKEQPEPTSTKPSQGEIAGTQSDASKRVAELEAQLSKLEETQAHRIEVQTKHQQLMSNARDTAQELLISALGNENKLKGTSLAHRYWNKQFYGIAEPILKELDAEGITKEKDETLSQDEKRTIQTDIENRKRDIYRNLTRDFVSKAEAYTKQVSDSINDSIEKTEEKSAQKKNLDEIDSKIKESFGFEEEIKKRMSLNRHHFSQEDQDMYEKGLKSVKENISNQQANRGRLVDIYTKQNEENALVAMESLEGKLGYRDKNSLAVQLQTRRDLIKERRDAITKTHSEGLMSDKFYQEQMALLEQYDSNAENDVIRQNRLALGLDKQTQRERADEWAKKRIELIDASNKLAMDEAHNRWLNNKGSYQEYVDAQKKYYYGVSDEEKAQIMQQADVMATGGEELRKLSEQNEMDRLGAQGKARLRNMDYTFNQQQLQQRLRYNRSRIVNAIQGVQQRRDAKEQEIFGIRDQRADAERNQKYYAKELELAKKSGNEEAIKKAQIDYDKATAQLNNLTQAEQKAQSQLDKLNSAGTMTQAVFGAIGQSLSMVARRFGRQMFYKALNEAKRFVKEFNASMTTIQMITLKTDSQMSALGDGLISKAKQLKVSISEVTKAAEILYRQGLSEDEVNERLDVITKFSKVSGTKVDAATKLVTIAVNTGLVTDAQQAADIVTALGDNAATNATEIEKGIEKAGAAAAADGTSFAELASMLTAITSTTQIGGNVAGRTLNTIFGRMNKIGTNELIIDENGNMISGSAVATLLQKQGIRTYDENGNKRSSYDILYDLSKIWDNMSDAEQQQIANAVAGTRQYSNFSAIMQGMSEGKVDEYMKLAADSTGITDEKYDIYAKSLQAALEDLKTTFDSVIKDLVDSGALKSIVGGLKDIIAGIGGIIKAGGGLPAIIAMFGALAVISAGIRGGLAGAIAMGALVAGLGVVSIIGSNINATANQMSSKDSYKEYVNDVNNSATKKQSEYDRLIELGNKKNRTREEDQELLMLARSVGSYGGATKEVTDLTKAIRGLGDSASGTSKDVSSLTKSIVSSAEERTEREKVAQFRTSLGRNYGGGAIIEDIKAGYEDYVLSKGGSPAAFYKEYQDFISGKDLQGIGLAFDKDSFIKILNMYNKGFYTDESGRNIPIDPDKVIKPYIDSVVDILYANIKSSPSLSAEFSEFFDSGDEQTSKDRIRTVLLSEKSSQKTNKDGLIDLLFKDNTLDEEYYKEEYNAEIKELFRSAVRTMLEENADNLPFSKELIPYMVDAITEDYFADKDSLGQLYSLPTDKAKMGEFLTDVFEINQNTTPEEMQKKALQLAVRGGYTPSLNEKLVDVGLPDVGTSGFFVDKNNGNKIITQKEALQQVEEYNKQKNVYEEAIKNKKTTVSYGLVDDNGNLIEPIKTISSKDVNEIQQFKDDNAPQTKWYYTDKLGNKHYHDMFGIPLMSEQHANRAAEQYRNIVGDGEVQYRAKGRIETLNGNGVSETETYDEIENGTMEEFEDWETPGYAVIGFNGKKFWFDSPEKQKEYFKILIDNVKDINSSAREGDEIYNLEDFKMISYIPEEASNIIDTTVKIGKEVYDYIEKTDEDLEKLIPKVPKLEGHKDYFLSGAQTGYISWQQDKNNNYKLVSDKMLRDMQAFMVSEEYINYDKNATDLQKLLWHVDLNDISEWSTLYQSDEFARLMAPIKRDERGNIISSKETQDKVMREVEAWLYKNGRDYGEKTIPLSEKALYATAAFNGVQNGDWFVSEEAAENAIREDYSTYVLKPYEEYLAETYGEGEAPRNAAESKAIFEEYKKLYPWSSADEYYAQRNPQFISDLDSTYLTEIIGADLTRKLKDKTITDSEVIYAQRLLNNAQYGYSGLTVGDRLQGIKELREAVSNGKIIGDKEGQFSSTAAAQYLTGWNDYNEYVSLLAKRENDYTAFAASGGEERLKELNVSLENFQKNTEIEFEITGISELEKAGKMAEGTAEAVKKLRQGGAITLEVITKYTSEGYASGQQAAKLYNGTVEEQDEAAMAVLGMTREQYYSNREANYKAAQVYEQNHREMNGAMWAALYENAPTSDDKALIEAAAEAAGYKRKVFNASAYGSSAETTSFDYEGVDLSNIGSLVGESRNYSELEKANTLVDILSGKTVRRTGKNGNTVLFDEAVGYAGERTRELLRQWQNESNDDLKNLNFADWMDAANISEEDKKLVLAETEFARRSAQETEALENARLGSTTLGGMFNYRQVQYEQNNKGALAANKLFGVLSSSSVSNIADLNKLVNDRGQRNNWKDLIESSDELSSKLRNMGVAVDANGNIDFSGVEESGYSAAEVLDVLKEAASEASESLKGFNEVLSTGEVADRAQRYFNGEFITDEGKEAFSTYIGNSTIADIVENNAMAYKSRVDAWNKYNSLSDKDKTLWEETYGAVEEPGEYNPFAGLEGENLAYAQKLYANAQYGQQGISELDRLRGFQQAVAAASNGQLAEFRANDTVRYYNDYVSAVSGGEEYLQSIEKLNNAGIDFSDVQAGKVAYEQLSEALGTEEAQKFLATQKEIDAELSGAFVKASKKAGEYTDDLASSTVKLTKGGISARKELARLSEEAKDYQDAVTVADKYRGKTGAQIANDEVAVKQLGKIGFSKDEIQSWSAEQAENNLQLLEDVVNEEFAQKDLSAVVDNALSQVIEAHPNITVNALANADGYLDLSKLADFLDGIAPEVAALLREYDGIIAESSIKLETGTDKEGNPTISVVQESLGTTKLKSGASSGRGYNHKGSGGGGGKSEVDKLLEEQKRRIAEIEHQSKMLEIKEKHYDFINDYSAYDNNIDDQIATQERLRAAYAQNISEMNAMLAKTEQGSDDWYKLKDAIMAAEEAIESVSNTINELNQKRINALEQKQTNEDKPDTHALTMLQKRAAKYQRSGQFEAYDITMQQTIDITREQITQNNKQIKEWEDLLKTYQEGSDSWIETRDKIWALKEENAELENQMASDLIDLQEARIAQIAKDLENAQAPFEHANAMLDTFGQMYQSTRNQSGYRGTLEDTIENNKRLKALNDTAIEELKKQIDGMKESDPARENAISTLYQLEEASAKYEASILSNRQAIEESLINEVKDYHGENNAVLEHELKLLSEKEKEYSRNNDYINHENILGEKARAVGEQLAEQRAALEDYIELQNSGRITQGSEQWKELEETIRSTKESVYELTNAEREAIDAFEQAQFANLQKMYKEGFGDFVGMDQLNHERTLIQYRQNGYQNKGELTNYGVALGWEKNVLLEERAAIMAQIEAVEELQKLHKDNPELYYQETEELRKLEEQLQKNTNDYEKLTEAEKKNINAILATISAVKKTADSAIRETVQKEKQMLSATINMQNSILEVIRKNFQEQWDLEKKTIEKKKQALAEEKNLITERMNFRKKMMDQEAKDEELAELKRQLVLISADSTRTKEANELRRKINEMEKQNAIQTAEDIANAEIKSIEDRTQAMNDYVTVYEEDLSNLLKNANNFVEIIDDLLGGSFEDFIEWNAKYNESYKNATEEQRLQMRNSWEDSWREMLGQLKLYWEEADEVSRSKESWLALATSTDSFKSLSASDQQIRLNELSDQYDAMIKAQINNAEFDDTHEILTTLSDMKDWVFNVNIIGLEDYLISSKYSDYVYNRDKSIGDTSDTHDNYEGVGYVAPAQTSVASTSTPSVSSSGTGTSGGISAPSETYDVIANNNGAYGVVRVNGADGKYRTREEAKAYADQMNTFTKMQKIINMGFSTGYETTLPGNYRETAQLYAKERELFITKNDNGGLMDYTGLAWVDGTKTRPESFLDATDTKLLRDMLDSYNFIKTSPYMTHIDDSNYGKGSISVGDVNVNLYEAKLENDADYELIAQKVGKAFTKELQKDGFNLAGYAW